MVKTKQRRTGKFPGKKSGTSDRLIDSAGYDHQQDEVDWVIVKKQRVTILVPPDTYTENSLTSNQGPKTASNCIQLLMETSTVQPSGNGHDKSILLAAQKETQVVRKAPAHSPNSTSGNEHEKTILLPSQGETQFVRTVPAHLPNSTFANSPRVDQRTESENPHQASILTSHKLYGVSNTSKSIKQTRTLLAPRGSSSITTSLNQGLRASNLERKLERAGGLSRWLKSLGLGQFVRIFQGKCLNKYQLVNLTMKKLKDMGASAVGPRRKLIHAIDCVCQPYCFEAL